MLRRLKFFAVGALFSIIFLSLGPENRLKSTFEAYIDYFNDGERVIGQMLLSDSTNFFTFDKDKITDFYKGAWVNWKMTKKEEYPQVYVLDNSVNSVKKRLTLYFYNNEIKKLDGDVKRYTRLDIQNFEEVEILSKRSYKNYQLLIGIFLLIMIPTILLVRRLLIKRKNIIR
tara:strand:- start:218 stop:733 length:516 start_codon:yes stop_codon:yes gene_type:complete